MKKRNERITNQVYEYRVLERLSQNELAERIGVSRQTIFLIEKGEGNPSLLLAFRIATYFGKGIDDIFTYYE
ncbi:helix-turn-helix transcriptional regulator [uncultured Vagococcus sp.]|uniref:helix-turn-helix transcriptional regulator n=1 Tax=uncultured Vagococcus sp. TaxID=189676 RepID=UPI0028D2D968|nr:helix-turn-helix transcriptional regulator [uncultured Vagococcus sp.]